MKEVSKSQAKEIIDEFFKKDKYTSEEVRKIKNISMKHRIRLGNYKKEFCKKCLNKIKGKIRIMKTHKTIICEICKTPNRFKIN